MISNRGRVAAVYDSNGDVIRLLIVSPNVDVCWYLLDVLLIGQVRGRVRQTQFVTKVVPSPHILLLHCDCGFWNLS